VGSVECHVTPEMLHSVSPNRNRSSGVTCVCLCYIKTLIPKPRPCRSKMGLADARIIDLEEEKAQLEEAKAAAEAASKEAFALREKQTERIKRTKAGGPGGESAVDLLPLWSYAL